MIFDPNIVCKLELSFLTHLVKEKKKMKIAFFFTICYVKVIFSIFYTQNYHFSINEGVLTSWVLVKANINGWYLFWYQWKEDVPTVQGGRTR